MAQEFASDNSKTGLFSRLKLSNHRGFFSFIFVTLSIIFILVTFSAIQQQQTTNTKASEINLCTNFDCSSLITTQNLDTYSKCTNVKCCTTQGSAGNYTCIKIQGAILTCSEIRSNVICDKFASTCDYDYSNYKCVQTGNINSTTTSAGTGGETTIEEKCRSYGLGANGEVNCAAKAAQNNVECKWEATAGSTTVGKCVPGSVTSNTTTGTTIISTVGSGQQCLDSNKNTIARCSFPFICEVGSGTCKVIKPEVVCDSCRNVGEGCSITGSIPCPGYKCSPVTSGSTVGKCVRTTTTGNACDSCTAVGQGCSVTGSIPCHGFKCSPISAGSTVGTCKSTTTTPTTQRPPGTTGTGGGDSACTSISGRCLTGQTGRDGKDCKAVTGQAGSGKIQSGLCSGGADRKCCVPNSSTGGGNDGDVELNLKLSYQGIITLPKTKTELKVKVKLVDAENREKENDVSTFTADANGIWSGKVTFENVDLSQKYYLLIKGPMHVQKKICKADAADPNPGYYSCQFGNITLTTGVNTFDFSQVKMLVGDLDQNGLVNREDTGPLLNALLLDLDQRKSTGILEKLDLNLDGIVEPKDWSLMLEALKIKYDEE